MSGLKARTYVGGRNKGRSRFAFDPRSAGWNAAEWQGKCKCGDSGAQVRVAEWRPLDENAAATGLL